MKKLKLLSPFKWLKLTKYLKEDKKYRIGNIISSGSYSDVYYGYQINNKKKYAVKVLYDYDESIKSEINFFKKDINNKNIIKYHNIFYKNDSVNIVMDLYKYDLYNYYYKFILSEDIIKIIIKQVIYGMLTLQEHDIYHTDIKLENILLNDYNHIVLTDFGSYVSFKKNNELIINTAGSYAYNSPEIFKNKFYKNSNMWNVGVIIYNLITDKNIYVDEINYYQKIKNNLEIKTISNDMKDFIFKLLQPNHLKRSTIEEIIIHKWLCDN